MEAAQKLGVHNQYMHQARYNTVILNDLPLFYIETMLTVKFGLSNGWKVDFFFETKWFIFIINVAVNFVI